jgi:hypothetical protein
MRAQIVGMVTATAVLFVMVFAVRGLFMSPGGLAVAGLIGIAAGGVAGILADSSRPIRTVATVIGFVVLLMLFYASGGMGTPSTP